MLRRVALSGLLLVPFAARADAWWGTDKALHLSVSAGLSGAGYAASALFFDRWIDRALVGFGAAWTIGVAKEIADGFGAGDPSLKDLAWDAIGCLVGTIVSTAIDRWIVTPLLQPVPGSS